MERDARHAPSARRRGPGSLGVMTLILDSLRKRFGDVVALDGISFTVHPGDVFGFLGANRAGKTTAMCIMLDILRADSGPPRSHVDLSK